VRKAPPGERFLSVDELAQLHDGFDCDYGRMFFWLQLSTAGRKEAILELTRFRCDTRRLLIRLNPEGREQTAKHRATLPMVPYLVPLIEACRDGYLVNHNGAKLGDIKAAWRRARVNAGLPGDVNTTAMRRTVATWLRRKNVPEAECAAWMGHRWTNSTTEKYANWRPDYLATAARAVDELLRAVAGESEARAAQTRAAGVLEHPGRR
jgi:Phage integrase family